MDVNLLILKIAVTLVVIGFGSCLVGVCTIGQPRIQKVAQIVYLVSFVTVCILGLTMLWIQ